MALTIDNTLTGEFANSYVDVAFADNYWADHFILTKVAQWQALTANQKANALIAACRVIETARFTIDYRMPYNPNVTLDVRSKRVIELNDGEPIKWSRLQKLQFPRNKDRHSDGSLFIPDPVMWAQCEQAVYLLSFDETAAANQLQGIDSDQFAVGEINTRQKYRGAASMFAPTAYEFVRPFLLTSSAKSRRA
jgi:hypothetical protein